MIAAKITFAFLFSVHICEAVPAMALCIDIWSFSLALNAS